MTGRTNVASNISKQDNALFTHKAIKALWEHPEHAFQRQDPRLPQMPQQRTLRQRIGAILGVSERTVRACLNSPCPAFEAERAVVAARANAEARNAILVPFIRPDDDLTDNQLRLQELRQDVRHWSDEGMKDADIARHLDISRQMVAYYLKTGKTDCRKRGISVNIAA